MGGFPGEKKRSLTFGALLNIADNNAVVEIGALAGALAVPAAGTDSSAAALVAVVTCSAILLNLSLDCLNNKMGGHPAVTEVTRIAPKRERLMALD